jgi:sulfur carrier protein
MKIVLNGAPQQVEERITVAGLVRDVSGRSPDGRGVAVAVDAAVVPRSAWETVELTEGQRVEVVGAIQGG